MSEYDISHLAPHTVIFVIPANLKKGKPEIKYPVEVVYSNHCYTKAAENSQRREFDSTRYELSKKLPEIISELMECKCSFAHGRNYFTVNASEHGEYEIYFEVFKKPKTKKLSLRVQSAYVRDKQNLEKRHKWESIKFSTILFNVLNNKPVRPPR